VRNNPLTLKVSTPEPKWLDAIIAAPVAAGRHATASSPVPPFHSATNGAGLRISQPWAFAMLSGRQR